MCAASCQLFGLVFAVRIGSPDLEKTLAMLYTGLDDIIKYFPPNMPTGISLRMPKLNGVVASESGDYTRHLASRFSNSSISCNIQTIYVLPRPCLLQLASLSKSCDFFHPAIGIQPFAVRCKSALPEAATTATAANLPRLCDFGKLLFGPEALDRYIEPPSNAQIVES